VYYDAEICQNIYFGKTSVVNKNKRLISRAYVCVKTYESPLLGSPMFTALKSSAVADMAVQCSQLFSQIRRSIGHLDFRF